ncbi:hypothetical protein LOY97_004615 [Ophidiomyces ophidiicola]|nr:hypothetical protein LOZ08_005424 [Ophidiomyces ophidiicola]KAI2458155.1 hypothetical protein LOY97_004615 [Ophidiomyces ophidiicola]
MTPMRSRSVTGVNFARQLAEYRQENQPPAKKFKSSAPKGTKFSGKYTDRTLLRQNEEEVDTETGKDSRGKRVEALEEMVKLGQIDTATFEKLKNEIGIGGDVESTHLVKGLDWKLLQKVKAGEDVAPRSDTGPDEHPEGEGDIGDEFERIMEEREKEAVAMVEKQERVKKGNMAPPPGRLSRDEILKQLKASRAAGTSISLPQNPPMSILGDRFKKIGASDQRKRWVETDGRGRRREVLVVTDSQGKSKRKVRWLDKDDDKKDHLLTVDKDAQPLGMEVPAEVLMRANAISEPEEEDDIFEGVGADYNPLAEIEDDDSSSDSETELAKTSQNIPEREITDQTTSSNITQASGPRNYFDTGTTSETVKSNPPNGLSSDPTILAALKHAAKIGQQTTEPSDEQDDGEVDGEALLRRRKFLEKIRQRDQEDAMDLDLGFGESRFGDDDEDEELWDERGTGNKRKRGPKKRKGNKDSASDVMSVLQGRKKTADKA